MWADTLLQGIRNQLGWLVTFPLSIFRPAQRNVDFEKRMATMPSALTMLLYGALGGGIMVASLDLNIVRSPIDYAENITEIGKQGFAGKSLMIFWHVLGATLATAVLAVVPATVIRLFYRLKWLEIMRRTIAVLGWLMAVISVLLLAVFSSCPLLSALDLYGNAPADLTGSMSWSLSGGCAVHIMKTPPVVLLALAICLIAGAMLVMWVYRSLRPETRPIGSRAKIRDSLKLVICVVFTSAILVVAQGNATLGALVAREYITEKSVDKSAANFGHHTLNETTITQCAPIANDADHVDCLLRVESEYGLAVMPGDIRADGWARSRYSYRKEATSTSCNDQLLVEKHKGSVHFGGSQGDLTARVAALLSLTRAGLEAKAPERIVISRATGTDLWIRLPLHAVCFAYEPAGSDHCFSSRFEIEGDVYPANPDVLKAFLRQKRSPRRTLATVTIDTPQASDVIREQCKRYWPMEVPANRIAK